MLSSLGPRRYSVACLILIALGGLFAAQMARQTRLDVHPDELAHTHTFCYFETHGWLPPLNSDDVFYDLHGQSRVYSREVVYQLYGPATSPLARLAGSAPGGTAAAPCEARYPAYRLFNVLLLVVTLGVVFAVGARHPWAAALGVLMLGMPQVVYTYAYANSDAFALSMSVFVMLLALTERRPLTSWSRTLLLAALTALVILSKSAYWVMLVFVYGVLAWRLFENRGPAGRGAWREVAAHALVLLAFVLLLVAPHRLWYPLSQGGDFNAQVEQMREVRAIPALRPSTATYPTFRLRDQGVPFMEVLTSVPWLVNTAMSFYGLFGYATEHAPRLAYAAALLVLAGNLLATLVWLKRCWREVPRGQKLILLWGLVIGGLSILASMAYSWVNDFQAQGRYLFPLLVPLALWFTATWSFETPRLRALRLLSAALLVAASFYTLWQAVLQNPTLV